jgi:hypothetical protein
VLLKHSLGIKVMRLMEKEYEKMRLWTDLQPEWENFHCFATFRSGRINN